MNFIIAFVAQLLITIAVYLISRGSYDHLMFSGSRWSPRAYMIVDIVTIIVGTVVSALIWRLA